MGARGKKRRRADGSVAGKPIQSRRGYTGHVAHEALAPVPLIALAKAAAICWRYQHPADTPPSDWDLEKQFDELNAFSEAEGVDAQSLGTRADKLVQFLLSPAGRGVFSSDENALVIDDTLLEFAATSYLDDSNKALIWPPPASLDFGA